MEREEGKRLMERAKSGMEMVGDGMGEALRKRDGTDGQSVKQRQRM